MKRSLLTVLLLGVPLILEAALGVAQSKEEWHCFAQDYTNKRWVVVSSHELFSIHEAMQNCKKESNQPKSCSASISNCEGFINGVSIRPLWRCTALDSLANPWFSAIHWKADNAIFSARSRCQRHSPAPETCYVNAHTCKNLNHH